ncbi:MAG: hypothetical protein JXN64_00740 [Spirochaetes bacterium]|nr:hypothetical protein [Spirochaetota bacterium]
MNNSINRSFIEETQFYRGQIVYSYDRPQISSETSFVDNIELGDFNPYSAYDTLYKHQADLANELQSGKNILFLSPFNTGKTTLGILYALDVLFNKHKSMLIISANSFEKELEKKLINKILVESKLDWLVDIHDIKEEVNKNSYVGLFPSIYIIEARDLHWFLLPNHNKYSSLFESLGLVIYDDFEKFSGSLASNIHFIFKRFELIYSIYNKDKQPLQYLILSKPFNESKRIVERIFNENFDIMHRDSKDIIPAKIFYWIPAFDKVDVEQKTKSDPYVRTTRRDSFIDDTYILAIESLKKSKKTVVYYYNIPLSKDDIKNSHVFLDYNKRIGDFNLDAQNDFFIGYDWSDLTSQLVKRGLDWEQIDTLIISMFNGSINDLRDDILHVGMYNTEIFITMPQTPSFQYEINHPSIDINKSVKEIAKGESNSLFAFSKGDKLFNKHLLLSKYEMRNFQFDDYKDKFTEMWGKETTKNEQPNDCEAYFRKISEHEGYDIFSTDDENYFLLLDSQENIVGSINPHELPDSYFLNAVICSNNMRYQVNKIDLDNKKIYLLSLGKFSLSLSERELNIKSEKPLRDYNYNTINFKIKELTANATFNSYLHSNSTDTAPESFRTAGENNMSLNDIKINSVEISGFKSPEAFANIFDISLNTKMSLYNLVPFYFIASGKSYFYNLGGDDLNYIINDNNINDLLSRALDILIDCPCQSGCPGCLESFKSPKISFSKKELIDYIGDLIRKDNLTNIKRWKYEGIGQVGDLRGDMDKFRQIRNKVFDILQYKANMIINNPYQEKFISADDKKWISSAGLCHPAQKTIYIQPGFNEDIFTEICAHEYTHNWQFEGNLNNFFWYFNKSNIDDINNIWFSGLAFIEGQANFFSAKAMDYFGLREMVYHNEVYSYAQYREGLILLNYLEKKYGLINLNHILKEAKLSDGSPVTSELIYEWYDESGIKGLVQGLGDDLIQNNCMRCLQYEFLNKSRDYNRLTYFMNHQICRPDDLLSEYIDKAEMNEDEAFDKIWTVLKDHFKIIPKVNHDYLPCKECEYKNEGSLEGLCMMFGSIDVKPKILIALGL